MKSNDLFEMMGQANESYKKFIGMDKAQSAYDNASPNDEYEPEPTEDEEQAHNAYKFAMNCALGALNKQLELYKKYGKTDVCDSIENDIDEIESEIARRELKIV